MNERTVEVLLQKTGKSFAAATFMAYAPVYCRNYKDAPSDVDRPRQAIENFLRCIKRSLYFCRQTLYSIQQCLDDDLIRFFRDRIVSLEGTRIWDHHIPYAETVVFNFDAFVFSVRTLFEKRLVKSLKALGCALAK